MEGYTEFRNTTGGALGAVKIDRRGEHKSTPVQPGDTIWLSEEEQEATANAPRRPSDNPFIDHPYKIQDPDTGEVIDEGSRPLFERVTETRSTGRSRPIGDDVARTEGSYGDREEVGTPVGD